MARRKRRDDDLELELGSDLAAEGESLAAAASSTGAERWRIIGGRRYRLGMRLRKRPQTRSRKILPGWTRIGGSAEWYVDPQGYVVTRRTYEDERAKRAGWDNWADFQKTRRPGSRYMQRVKQALDNESDISREDIGVEGFFSRLYTDVRRARRTNDVNELRDPNGALANLLVFLGHRDPTDWWDVGDTPGESDFMLTKPLRKATAEEERGKYDPKVGEKIRRETDRKRKRENPLDSF